VRNAEKLLIVEDNPLIVRAMEKAGERLNLQVDVATDGWDAIEKLRTGQYAAIVIDADLPRHSGYGVITYLRQENGEHLENVVLMTSAETINVRHRVSEHLRVIATTEVVDEIAAAVSSACSEER
jgi:two-component system, sensor histidine kinase and response regulator